VTSSLVRAYRTENVSATSACDVTAATPCCEQGERHGYSFPCCARPGARGRKGRQGAPASLGETRHNIYTLPAGRSRGRSSSPGRVKNFLFPKLSRPALKSTQPPIQWVPGALSLGVKRPGREVDHSPPTSAEVKKMWIYTSTPVRLHGVVLN
jgi:hypothetical protein